MAHVKLNLDISRRWLEEQIKKEPDSGVTSVGGLASRCGEFASPRQHEPDRPFGILSTASGDVAT